MVLFINFVSSNSLIVRTSVLGQMCARYKYVIIIIIIIITLFVAYIRYI